MSDGRTSKIVMIGYRIYLEKGSRTDEKGNFEGYSSKYDESVNLYSPRIQPFMTKTTRSSYYDDYNDIDDDFDHQFPCEEGHQRVIAVPRIRKCASRLFIHMMNEFGHLGGFDLILEIIGKICENCQTQEELNTICTLIEMSSKPYLIYHKEFQKEFFPKLIQLARLTIRNAPDKFIRDINRDKVDVVIRSIDNMKKRIMTKEEREKETEVMKLEMSLICLKSSYLERRIQGIKDLNQLIKNNRVMSSKNISNAFLVQWLKDNDVFPLLFDPKKTHLQIVQRLSDILKLLLQENELTQPLFEMFWNLSKSDYKLEIYKILNDAAFYLKKEHFDFVLNQLIGTSNNVGNSQDKISIDDYSCLNELTKYAKDESFKINVNKFFWDMIFKADQERSGSLIVNSLNFIRTHKIQTYKPPQQNASEVIPESVNEQIDTTSQQQPAVSTEQNDMEKLVIESVIKNLNQYCIQVQDALANQQNAEQLIQNESRKKLYLVNHKYSHHEEIDERLQFLKYVSTFSSSYKITKQELNTIYDLLVKKSRIPSDQEEFLTWCKSLCESSSISNSILDLNEVGEFFTEKMKSKEMNVKTLPLVGFEFLQHYFLSVNEKASKLLKSQPKQSKSKFVNSYNFYGSYQKSYNNKSGEEDDKSPIFKLITSPANLDQLDIVWNVALSCENPKVVPKAINFLIKVHYQLDEDLNDKKCSIQDDLIKQCMEILGHTQDEFTCNRVIEIIKHIIYEAEKKGTGDVQPHNAVLKGELLERISIKYRSSSKKNNIVLSIYSNTTVWEFKKEVSRSFELAPKYLKLERSNGQVLKDLDNGKTLAEIGIQSYETLSAYKLLIEEEIANAPLIGSDGKLIGKAKEIFNEWFDLYSDENGSMTKETCALFIKGCTGEHPPTSDDRITGLFNQYDINKDGKIERTEFISFYETASRTKPETVRENLKAHNVRADLKKLSEIQEETSFKTEDMPRFKISETQQYFDKLMELLDRHDSVAQSSWDLIQMLATNRIIYTRVLQLKTAMDEQTGKINWAKFFDSQSDYKLLYTLQIVEAVMEEGEGQNLERILIIEDTPSINININTVVNKNAPPAPPLQGSNITPNGNEESGSGQKTGEEEKPKIVETVQNNTREEHSIQMKKNNSIIEESEYQKLKSEWTSMFLMNEGIQYIMKVFMDKEIKGGVKSFSTIFELKHIAFLLKLLRIFIMAAFSTSKESQVYEMAASVRRSSSIQEESSLASTNQIASQSNNQDSQSNTQEGGTGGQSTEGSRFKELQTLLAGPLGEEIIEQIDYKLLQKKILTVIAQILSKQELIFEDKLIIENALSLWVGCVVHKNELFNEFYNFKGEVVSGEEIKIQNCDNLILHGLLYSPYEKVREEFRYALSSISFNLSSVSSAQKLVINPLKYLLTLLSDKITEISNYHSKQYFDLFCSIIEYYFTMSSQGVRLEKEEEDFNPEKLLAHIIDKIKEYNQVNTEIYNQLLLQIAMELSEKENSAAGGGVSGGLEGDEEVDNYQSSELETVYIGLIQLTSKIIDNFDIAYTAQIVESKNLIEEIFVKFLFSSVFKEGKQQKEIKIQPKKQRKTQKKQTFGKKSKDAAYKLIFSLIKRTPTLMKNFMERSMVPLMRNIRRLEVWNYQNQSSSGGNASGSSSSSYGDKKQKYVGLRNLGCICYMNSMLQQFFMIPAFRYNLLCVDDHTPEDLKEYKGQKVDDNMLHQLQKLMAHLELSERSDYNPFEFCFAFKEIDGNPTNTGEQKDAQEFLNLAFDRIETLLKPTSRKYLLQSVFGGQTCSQLVCQECGKVKNRIEDFYNLSLTIKDIKSMYESLQKLIEGEVINDYQCEGCGKKVDVSKRTLISQTPNVLIVHLQRITFNFDTFRNDKVNTYFEFPYQLDLKPYSFYEVMKKEKRIKVKTGDEEDDEGEMQQQEESKQKEGEEENQWPEEDDCYEYKLVGTTVHSGTANAGHYWSYINTRRGYLEPNCEDANWNKTENDPWMEFNDSRVNEFNFEKLKDECFGDQKSGSGGGSSGYDDGWSSWGSYGKSAYMLIYERKKKKPIKVVVPEEEAKVEGSQSSEQVQLKEGVLFDEKKQEYIKLIDYREGVEDIAPNMIYKQVYDDNKKYEFDNDIYSQEFFEFIKSILQAALTLAKEASNYSDEQQKAIMKEVNQHVLYIGKKSILEILAKCFYNQQIKNLVEILIEIMKINEELCFDFMKQCYEEDNFEYLMIVMLECSDAIARLNVCKLVKFLITKLKLREKDILADVVAEEYEVINQADQSVEKRVAYTPKAMTTKFIQKCLDNLNTLVAKNWSRFEYFLDVLYCFGCGENEINDIIGLNEQEREESERIGLEFLYSQQFIGKACDFLLGRKSPIASPNEKRYEMGGSYSTPNFSAMMKLITKMINNGELSQKYPLKDFEKRLLLHHDLLKVMLAQNIGSKQFGLCLANMCRDNLKYSKKVSKIFIKVINASSYDNVKNYLKALKPFLKMSDSLKKTRLEWIFGFQQIATRKEYRDINYKFGLELIAKINDEVCNYVSPIINSHSEEALLSQLLKCKGRLDTFAINCLKEMLSLMTKDDDIGRYIYQSGPPTYQYARYTDWIKPYLEGQKAELEKTSSYIYMKNKYDTTLKALKLFTIFEEKCKGFAQLEEKDMLKDKSEGKNFEGAEQDWWAYQNEEVLKHYPPQIIIGKQVGEERVIMDLQDDPLVGVQVIEITNDYNYSNPTGIFNLSLPHIEFRTSMYQTISYTSYRRSLYQSELKAAQRKTAFKEDEEEIQEEEKAIEEEDNEVIEQPQQSGVAPQEASPKKEEKKEEVKEQQDLPQEPEIKVRDWYENKKEGKVLLKVSVFNKSSETIKYRVTLRHANEQEYNIVIPQTFMTDTLYPTEPKVIGYFQKIDPTKDWSAITVDIQSVKKTYGQPSGFSNQPAKAAGSEGKNNQSFNENIEFKINVKDQGAPYIHISDIGHASEKGRQYESTISCVKCQTQQSAQNIKCIECKEFLTQGTTSSFDPQNIYEDYYGN